MLDLWNPHEVRRELTFASCLLPIHELYGAGEEEEKKGGIEGGIGREKKGEGERRKPSLFMSISNLLSISSKANLLP